jgi:hypothetical protein
MLSIRASIDDRELTDYLQAHPEFDPDAFDFHSRLGAADVPPEHLLDRLATYRRLAQTGAGEASGLLIAAGMVSAHHIAALPEDSFVERHAKLFATAHGIDDGSSLARLVYRRSVAIKTTVAHAAANLRDLAASPALKSTLFHNASADVIDLAQSIPGYQDLFGSLDFCSCPECQSIFGPAAYFVDIMRISQQYITDRNPKIPTGFRLSERRPDLFTLELTCANTNNALPYLSLVNQILTDRLRAAGIADVDFTLATAFYPFNAPFNVRLCALRANINQLGSSLARVFSSILSDAHGVTLLDVAREILGLSVEQLMLVSTPASAPASLAASYGYGTDTSKVPAVGPGTVDFAAGSSDVVGTGTSFGTGVLKDQLFTAAGEVRRIKSIADTTHLTVDQPFTKAGNAVPYFVLPIGGLQQLDDFMARTGLDQTRVVSLLGGIPGIDEQPRAGSDMLFVNATGEDLPPMHIVLDTSNPATPLSRIDNVSPKRFDRINRFVRLSEAVGWTFPETDCAVACTGQGEIDATAIQTMAVLKTLMDATGAPVDVICSFWSTMPIGGFSDPGPKRLFDRVFNNPAVLNGQNPYALAPGQTIVPFDPLNPDHRLTWKVTQDIKDGLAKSAAPSPAPPNAAVRSRLLGALGIADADLTTIGTYLVYLLRKNGDLPAELTLSLDLPTMTWLYRLAKWPSLFKMTVDEILELLCLLYYPTADHLKPPPAAFTPSPAVMAQINETVAWLAASGYSVYELQYIMLADDSGQSKYVNPGYRPADIAPFLASTSALAKPSFVTPEALVLNQAAPPVAQIVFSQLVDQGFLTPEGIFLDKDITADSIDFVYYLDKASFITEGFITAPESEAAYKQLLDKGVLVAVPQQTYAAVSPDFTIETSLSFLFDNDKDAVLKRSQVRSVLQLFAFDDRLIAGLIADTVKVLTGDGTTPGLRTAQVQTLIEALARFLRCDAAVMALLPPLNTPVGSAAIKYLAPFLSRGADPAPTGIPAGVIAKLSRSLLLAQKLGLGLPELAAIVAHPANFGISNISNPTLPDIQVLSDFARLNAQFRNTQRFLGYLTLPADTSRAACVAELAAVTGWDAAQLAEMVDYFWPQPTDTGYRTLRGIILLNGVFSLAAKIRGDTASLRAVGALAGASLNGADANAVWAAYAAANDATRNAVQSKFGAEFNDVYAEMSGTTDTELRDRLVSYTKWTLQPTLGGYPTSNALYQYLLIDVEMSDCDKTSKIALGIASVQLYMQRCRLRLEPEVNDLASIPDAWWLWMSQYRVWQANRKIFLYPENYIDPTLRTGVTDQFRQMQQELLQSNITQGSVDTAFRNYFDSFATVSNLVYVDCYGVPGTDGTAATGIIHVIGRTATTPYTYYRRTYEPLIQRWGQWLKIELTIKAPAVSVMHAYGRLYLFWVDIETKVVTSVTTGNEEKSTANVAEVAYSFLNSSGTWVSAQHLGHKITVNVIPDTYTSKLVFPYIAPGMIHVEDPWWHKPYVLKLPSQTDDSDLSKSQPERLMVLVGSVFRLPDSSIEVPDEPTDTDPNLLEFNTAIYQATNRAQQTVVKKLTRPGYIFLDPVAILPPSLRQSDRYFITLDYNDLSVPPDPQPFSGGIDRANAQVITLQTGNVIYDDYFSGYVGRSGTPGARTLLYNIDVEHGSLTPVKNLPGWFFYNNSDEAFLMTPNDPGILSIAGTLTISKSSVSGETGEIDLWNRPYTRSPQPFNALKFGVSRLTTRVVGPLSERLFVGGIDFLLTIEAQQTPELPFQRFYNAGVQPDTLIVPPLATFDQLDFYSAYGPYFREIFFHGPFLIAWQLAANRRFEDALHWLQYVFDPTHAPEPADQHPSDRFWRYLPFRSITPQSLASILQNQAQIQAYNDHPFDPDVIADLRPTAYQKAVVMKYIDVLLLWADALFAQDTRESITAATNLYVLAQDLLGPRPRAVGLCPDADPVTFKKISDDYPAGIPQFYIELEHSSLLAGASLTADVSGVPFNELPIYFCVPDNPDMMAYWDRVEDGLYKIRHCQNLSGIERTLALFAPPIDPRALIRAASAGASGMQVASLVEPPIPYYRFDVLIARAKGVAASVSQLGNALLSALEKKDAEELALLRTTQEAVILNLTTSIREWRINEVSALKDSLAASRKAATDRLTYYDNLIEHGLSPGEQLSLDAMTQAFVFNLQASIVKLAASVAYGVPNVGSPFAMTYGGREIGAAINAASGVFELGSMIANFVSSRSATTAGYDRREQEWRLQATLAGDDVVQVDAQLQANELQMNTARQELALHRKTIEQNTQTEAFLRSKFTNLQLYQWMVGQISTIYFQAYTLALNIARSAQRAYQYELNSDRNFIAFGYWDDLHKGLTAGDGLMLALDQLEQAYIDGNARPREIERTVSLLQTYPEALLDLQRTGECIFTLPERLFDLDFPGQYSRKIKSISLSIPAVLGPYQSIKATLTQLRNDVLLKPNINGVKYLLGNPNAVTPDAGVLRSNWLVNQQVCLSRTQDDAGVFELNFRDERYLPFEGTGAVSSWRLSIPRPTNRFDLAALSDVIINLKYTALDGGTPFRDQVTTQPELAVYTGARALFLSQNYPQQWFAFITGHADPKTQTLSFRLPPNIVPPHIHNAVVDGFFIALQPTKTGDMGGPPFLSFALPNKPQELLQLSPGGYVQLPVPTGWGSVTIAEAASGDSTLVFTLDAVPDFLKGPDKFLAPEVLAGISLIVAFHGDVDWIGDS